MVWMILAAIAVWKDTKVIMRVGEKQLNEGITLEACHRAGQSTTGF